MLQSKTKTIVCIAPHPDDETLGCGGTLLKHIENGDSVHWIVVTEMSVDLGFSRESIDQRHKEIMDVADAYGFNSVHRLGFPAMRLDTVSMLDLVDSIGNVLQTTSAETIYIPFRNDAHTDHGAVFDASVACTKVFRYPSIKSVIAYETISETEFGLKPENTGFKPNLFIDINGHLDQKIEIMGLYKEEMAEFPFPRSDVTIKALAQLRGSQTGSLAAEAFMLLKEIR